MRENNPHKSNSSSRSPYPRWLAALVAVCTLAAVGCSSAEETTADAESLFVDAAESESARSSAPAEVAEDSATDSEAGLFTESPEPSPERLEANAFTNYGVRPFVSTDQDNLSTFALDVDTGSYVVARRWLTEGVLPPADSVRVEEYLNAFDYAYDAPRSGLSISVDGGPSPFVADNVLVRVGVQAERVADAERPNAALTFVIDTSGSMDRDDRLGLVKDALAELVDELDDDDTVAIAIYDDSSTVILEPTPAREERAILSAINDLRPGGSTNLQSGLETGYALAEEAFIEGGINRVILASDGVANAGIVDPERLSEDITNRAIGGIQLIAVGFGMGNYNDTTMEQLANRGDGFYAYVDTRDEAERLFEDDLAATAETIARDARIQVEFDSDTVEAYRLIGFENRGVLDQDFDNVDVDAGELFSGHSVTAIYELELVDGLSGRDDLGEIALRWQDPASFEWAETDADIEFRDITAQWSEVDPSLQLATTVAVWAEVLRESQFAQEIDLDNVAAEAERLADEFDTDDVDQFAELVARSAGLS